MRLDAFMADANARYYATHDPYRDFTTAPEISQVFGELLGLWAAIVWGAMGRPAPVILAELGPGRGTLMADARRAIAQAAPELAAACRLHCVETSPRLRAEQAKRLPNAVWHDAASALPPGPLILLANEFLDALPIRQFVRRDAAWRERFVTGGQFDERPSEFDGPAASDGTVVERNDAARALVSSLATRIAGQGGAALFLDYGPELSAPGDSLQALRGGHPADPLAAPGESDLTAHVDFEALAAAASGVTVWGPVPQGPFLARLGLYQRTDHLARSQPPDRAAALIAAAQRLAEPGRMGRLFKVLALAHASLPCPPGFAA